MQSSSSSIVKATKTIPALPERKIYTQNTCYNINVAEEFTITISLVATIFGILYSDAILMNWCAIMTNPKYYICPIYMMNALVIRRNTYYVKHLPLYVLCICALKF